MLSLISRIFRRRHKNGRHVETRLDLGEIESLESRVMMAGNVDVFATAGGALRIVGDANANAITVSKTPTNLLLIQGTSGTTVTLNGSVDTLQFVDTGSLGGVGNLKIDMNAGNDAVTLADLTVYKNLRVKLDQGTDSLILSDSFVGRNVSVKGGTGLESDYVTIQSSAIEGSVNVNVGGAGDNIGGSLTKIDSVFVGGKLKLTSGAGDTSVRLENGTIVIGSTKIKTGAGFDSIQVGDTSLGKTVFNVGTGDDAVQISNSVDVSGSLKVTLGSGDDGLQVNPGGVLQSTFSGIVRFNGGAGFDRLTTFSDANYSSQPNVSQFEVITTGT